jgi:hypothetical protein
MTLILCNFLGGVATWIFLVPFLGYVVIFDSVYNKASSVMV